MGCTEHKKVEWVICPYGVCFWFAETTLVVQRTSKHYPNSRRGTSCNFPGLAHLVSQWSWRGLQMTEILTNCSNFLFGKVYIGSLDQCLNVFFENAWHKHNIICIQLCQSSKLFSTAANLYMIVTERKLWGRLVGLKKERPALQLVAIPGNCERTLNV